MSGTFQAGSIVGTMALDESPTIRALEKAKEATAGFKQVAERNLTEAGERGAEGFLRGLKEKFGRRSVFNESLELLAGGGVVAGIGLAAHQFEEITERIAKFSEAARSGKASGTELVVMLADSVPVLGDVAKGFASIYEACTGTIAAIDRDIEETQQITKELKEFHDYLVAAKEGLVGLTDEGAKLDEQFRQLTLHDPFKTWDRDAAEAGDKIDELKKKLFDTSKAGGAKVPDVFSQAAFDPASIEAQYQAAKAKLADLQNSRGVSKQLDKAFGQSSGSTDLFESQIASQQKLVDTLEGVHKAYQQYEADVAKVGRNQAIQDFQPALKSLEDTWKNLGKTGHEAMDRLTKDFEKQADEAKKLKESIETPAEKFAAQARDLKQKLGLGLLSEEQFLKLLNHGEQIDALSRGGRDFQPAIQAEEIFGSKTVTTADVPQPVAETAENTAEIRDINKTMSESLETISDLFQNALPQNALGVPTFSF